MKKNLIALSIMSVFAVQAYAQIGQTTTINGTATTTNTVKSPASTINSKDLPDTSSLNKKVLKEGESTKKELEKEKISPAQAATLDKNEAKIAKDLSNAKADGKISSDEKKYIKKEIDKNQETRSDMKDIHKENVRNAKSDKPMMNNGIDTRVNGSTKVDARVDTKADVKTNQVTDVVRPLTK